MNSILSSTHCVTLARALAVGVFVFAGCATLAPKSQLIIRTEPTGAEISTLNGDLIGTTPLTFSNEQLEKVAKDGRLTVVISAMGYAQRQLVLDLHGEDIHEIQLTKLDNRYFSNRLLRDFKEEANDLAKDLLKIQGLLVVKRLTEAEKAIEDFQKRYPNVAASYVLLANIELLKGNDQKAKGYLVRAQQLDPTDPVAARMLNGKGAKR